MFACTFCIIVVDLGQASMALSAQRALSTSVALSYSYNRLEKYLKTIRLLLLGCS